MLYAIAAARTRFHEASRWYTPIRPEIERGLGESILPVLLDSLDDDDDALAVTAA